MKHIRLAALAVALLWWGTAAAQVQGFGSGLPPPQVGQCLIGVSTGNGPKWQAGSCTGSGTTVSSVTGDGQVIASPTFGSVLLSLGTTITNNETASGLWNFTGGFQIGGAAVVARATNSAFGAVEGDGSTISCTAGVCSALGSPATSITVGTTTVGGGTDGYLLYETGGLLGALATTGTGNAVLATSPTLVTPALGAATATTLAVGGATLGGNAVAVTGSGSFSGGVTAASLTLSGLATGLSTCVNPSDGCPKSYIDALATGQTVIHTPVTATSTTTTAPTPNSPTYSNGASGVGATLTDGTAGAVLVIDGITISTIGTRVGITDLTFQNGIYTLTTAGAAGVTKWVLTRATDFDQATAGEIALGAQFSVISGTANINKNFWMNQTAAITVGTTAITFAPNPGCSIFTASVPGCVPASGGGTTNFLRADGSWSVPPGGGGAVTSVGLSVPAASILGVTGSPITSSGTLGLTTTGTSGGIPYFSSGTALSSSGTLTNHALVLGGGSGAAPTALGSLGTATTLLHGAAAGAPTFSAVALATDVSGNLPLANMATIGTNTVLGNATGGTAVPTALSKTQLTALVNNFSASLSGAVPFSSGGTLNFLRADGSWAPGTSGPSLQVCTTQTASYSLNYAGSLACATGSDVNGVVPFNPSGASVVFTVPQSTATVFPPGTGASVADIATATNPITACLGTSATWSTATTAPIASNALCPASGNGITILAGQTVQFVTDASNNWVPILTSSFAPGSANTWTAAQTFAAPVAVTSTTLAAPAAGSLALGGTASDPTLAANAEGATYLSATTGLRNIGFGSTYDWSVANMITGTPTTELVVAHGNNWATAVNAFSVGSTSQINANDKLSVSSAVTGKGISLKDSVAGGFGYFKILNDTTTPFTLTVNGSTDATDNCAVAACTQIAVTGGLYISGLSNANAGAYVCRTTANLIEFDNTACAASLRAVKRDIEPMHGALREALQLNPVWFRYKEGENDGGKFVHPGLVAEEVAPVDPRLASYTEKGKLEGVDYARMSALLVGSVHDLQHEIDIDRAAIGFLGFCVVVLFWRTRRKP